MGFFLGNGVDMVKKITFVAAAAIGVIFNGLTYAGTMGAQCEPGNVTVPCEDKRWEISVEALYLRPIVGNERTVLDPAADLVADPFAVFESRWGWGFGLAGAYHFREGIEASVSWMHYDQSTRLPFTSFGIIPSQGFLVPLGVSAYSTKILNRFDRANVLAGQHADVSAFKDVHFFAGLQYAQFFHEYFNYYAPTPTSEFLELTDINRFNKANFSGIGPVIGFDFTYITPFGVNLEGLLNSSLLYGNSRTITGTILGPSGLIVARHNASLKRVVPSLEAKLGLNVTREFETGQVSLYAGYQVLNYFNALIHITPTSTSYNNDYGLFGPYGGISWKGMA